jgi:hypothetical protein
MVMLCSKEKIVAGDKIEIVTENKVLTKTNDYKRLSRNFGVKLL